MRTVLALLLYADFLAPALAQDVPGGVAKERPEKTPAKVTGENASSPLDFTMADIDGKDVPLATGNLSEGLLVLDNGKFITLRVPYPMGYYAKGLDGRIDNPNTGWKGKGIYTPVSTRAPAHMEGGKGTLPKLVKFQMRPDPLAN